MKPRIEPDRQRNPELLLAVNETPNGAEGRPPLLPVRYPDPDLFICDVLDAIPKDDMASMEHPIFSLATKPDRRVFRYEHNGNKLEIVPSVKGLATIHDKDILIYCISQLIGKMNQGERPSRTLHLTARDLLVWTNRQTDGDGYDRLRSAFERLSGTRITTNIKADGEERSEEHTSELQSLMGNSYVVFCLKKQTNYEDWIYSTFMSNTDIITSDYTTQYPNTNTLCKPLLKEKTT